MFEYLKGKVEYKKIDHIALDILGVGYKIYISLREYSHLNIGDTVKLYIYNHIKEDDYKLIGFLNERERDMFQLLLSVKGIGVSLALAIISTFTSDKIIDLIMKNDYLSLKQVPKLGEKKSQQIILDLKNKLKPLATDISESDSADIEMEEDLIYSLQSLGYSNKEINSLIDREELKTYPSLEEAIKSVLRKIKK